MPMLKKKRPVKVSFNVKIPQELDERLKKIRSRARNNGMIFNVSGEVVKFLEKHAKSAERHLDEIDKEDIEEEKTDVQREFENHPAIKNESYLDDIPTFTENKTGENQ